MQSNPLTVFDREEIRAGIERKDPDEVIASAQDHRTRSGCPQQCTRICHGGSDPA